MRPVYFRFQTQSLQCNFHRDLEEDSSFAILSDTTTPISGARILCSALLLPTISTIIGRVFRTVESKLLKTLLGGLTFIAVKGTLKLILQHSEFVRKRHKKILDYTESNLLESLNNRVNIADSDAGSSGIDSNTSMELLVIENLMQI